MFSILVVTACNAPVFEKNLPCLLICNGDDSIVFGGNFFTAFEWLPLDFPNLFSVVVSIRANDLGFKTNVSIDGFPKSIWTAVV